MKTYQYEITVLPAKAGIQDTKWLDSRLCRKDGEGFTSCRRDGLVGRKDRHH